MNIQGGTLDFEVLFNNGQINSAMEETKRRVQGFSDATAAGGAKMEAAYQSAARYIEQGFEAIGKAISINETAIAKLQKKYNDLGAAAAEAFAKGDDSKYRNLTQQQSILQSEISQRKKVVAALNEQDAALLKHNQQLEDEKTKVDNAANAQVRFRTQLLNVKNEMMRLRQAGQTNTEEFKRLTAEATRLQQAMAIANTQVKNLANPNLTFQGVISGLSGISGAASVAQGAIGLFSEKNEDLQKIMLKVQSLMAITMGLQQVNNTLLSTSAFRLGIVAKAKEWWASATAMANAALLANTKEAAAAAIAADRLAATQARVAAATATVAKQEAARGVASTAAYARLAVAQKALTRAQTAHAAATTAQTAAAATATVANKGLAGAFRLVGAAIKSIPGIGWLLAAITALVAIYTKITSKAREAKKAQEEFYKAVAENASKPIAEFRRLQSEWENVGDSFQKKISVIKELKKIFEDLGVSINGVVDAEKILTNPSNVNAFISSQIAKARATAKQEEVEKLEKEAALAQQKLEDAQKTPKITIGGNRSYMGSSERSVTIDNPEIAKQEKALTAARNKMTVAITDMGKYQKEAFEQAQKATEGAIITYAAGTVGAIEQAIKEKQDALEGLKGDNKAYRKNLDEIAELQKQLAEITGKNTDDSKKTKKEKDPVVEQMEQAKKAYQEYFKWVNAGYQSEAKQEFSELLKGGKTYLDYLNKMKDDASLTKEQIHQITTEIAQETSTTILGEFESSLKEQLSNAQTVIDMLNVIKQQREELAKSTEEADPLKPEKEKIIEKQEEDIVKRQKEETNQLIADYSNYLDKKIMLELQLSSDMALLEAQRAKATTEADKKAIDATINNRRKKYNEDKANLLSAGYEAARRLADLEQDKEMLNISKQIFTWEADRKKAMLEAQKKAAQKMLDELEKIYKEAPTDEIADEIDWMKLKIKELNAELEKMPKEKLQEMLSGFQKITNALGNLDGEAGEIFATINNEIGNLKVAFDDTASKTDKISAGISSIVDIINMVSSASAERKRVEKEFYQNQIALVHEYALALNEQLRIQSELAGSGFVTNYAGKLKDGFIALSHATAQYQDALDKLNEGKAKTGLRDAVDWGNVGKGAAMGAAAGAAIGSIIPVIGTAVGAIAGTIVGGIVGLFGGKKKEENYGGLLDIFPELVDGAGNLNKELAESIIATNQVDDNTKQLIQNALEWADAVAEANAQIKEVVTDLAGDLGNSIKTAMIDAWKAGEESSKKMFEAASQSLEKFIEDLVYSTVFSDIFDEFADRLAKSLSPIGDGDVIDDYDYLMDKLDERDALYLASLEAIRNRAKQRGFDLWKPDEDANTPTSLSGAIKGSSQESIDLLVGQTNAVRVNQVESIEILRSSLIQLTMITANTGKANQHLAQIEKNTNNTTYDPSRAQGVAV